MTQGAINFYKPNADLKSCKISCQYCYHKWCSICAIIICIVAFLLLIIIVLQENVQDNPNGKNDNTRTISKQNENVYASASPCYNIFDCENENNKMCTCAITCTNIDVQRLEENIQAAVGQVDCVNNTLWLQKITFPNNKLNRGWFTETLPLKELKVDDCYYTDIEPNAFKNKAFSNLEKLMFIKTKVRALRKEMFVGLESITEFSMQQQGAGTINFESNLLEAFPLLNVLQVQEALSSEESLRNLIGTACLPGLELIDLRNNRLLTSLSAKIFNTPWLLKLYLTSCSLESIHEEAFAKARNIQLIDLRDNKLERLPENLFNGAPCLQMYISSNNWICDCRMKWVKKMTVYDWNETKCDSGININDSELVCGSPSTSEITSKTPEHQSLTPSLPTATDAASTVTIVTESSATATSVSQATATRVSQATKSDSSTSTTISTTTRVPYELVNLNCTVIEHVYPNKRLHIEENKVRNKTAKIIAHEDDEDINIVINGVTSNHAFIWINSDLQDSYGCYVNMENYFVLRKFPRNNNFIFCLMPQKDYTVSPLDCTSLKTSPNEKDQTWLKNIYKVPVIVGGTVIVVVLIILTAVLVFFYVRQNPKVLRGNKRIVIVKNSSTDVLVMPKKPSKVYSEDSRSTLKLSSQKEKTFESAKRDGGYLSPISQRYAQVRHRPPLVRSWSEFSGKGTIASYVAALEPKEHLSWTKCTTKTRTSVSQLFEGPPPLPPPRNKNTDVEHVNELIKHNE